MKNNASGPFAISRNDSEFSQYKSGQLKLNRYSSQTDTFKYSATSSSVLESIDDQPTDPFI